MSLSSIILKKQISNLKPSTGLSLKSIRKNYNKLGELVEAKFKEQVIIKKHNFENFGGAWVIPKDERREGVILYIHGGGYNCGNIDFASTFASMLAVHNGVRVFCVNYRQAPENSFPKALNDVLNSYNYLLDKGYRNIALCGENAGGGLCYSLILKLKEINTILPCCNIVISPWVDLTMSGESYKIKNSVDPIMTKKILKFFANNYSNDLTNPLISPLFGDLSDMPPSLIFVGEDDILLSDAQRLHKKLLKTKCKSKLIVSKEKWHSYLIYGLKEDVKDFVSINNFLNHFMSKENKLRWLRLDNAGKLYPATRRKNWSSMFRISATLKENIDINTMQTALDITVRRFPSIAVRLRKGLFWYYVEQVSEVPKIKQENSFPLTPMTKNETRNCALRVIVYNKRLAIEIFHSLTDGNGAIVFLKSLLAEYFQQRYGIDIPNECGILSRLEEPLKEEFEDSYQKYAGTISNTDRGRNAWQVSGTPQSKGFLNITCFELPVQQVLGKAHEYGISLTGFLCAVLIHALQNLQEQKVPNILKRKPIKILIPVNLRKLFKSKSLRNFVLYTTPEILPKLGRYSFEEICQIVHHHMATEITPKQMSMKIAGNIKNEHITLVKIMPLFIKNLIMKAIFDFVGERKSCFSISNLGVVKFPENMEGFIDRMDFILGIQATAPNNCAVLSFKDTLYINFIRNIVESDVEYHFHRVLQNLGLTAKVQSNYQKSKGD